MLAFEYISEGIGVIESDEKISTAIHLMEEQKTTHISVVNNGLFLGVISENSIFELNSFHDKISQHSILFKNISILENHHIFDVAKLAYLEQIDIIPVINKNGLFLGNITLQKLLGALTQLTSASEEGAVLILTMNINDLFISEIARLIESNDAKIINLCVTPIPQSTKIKVTIKINKIDINRIIQTLNRYNYIVESVYQEDFINDGLADKYKSFMKYLSI